MANFHGYQSLELIHRGPRSLVYRGVRAEDARPVVLKAHAKAYPLLAEITKLKQEYEVASALGLPGVVHCYGLEKQGNAFTLVSEDFGGTSLDRIEAGRPLGIPLFLRVAVELAGTLAAVHERGIVHKDIKPHNIVLTPDGRIVKLIDFGVASLLSAEQKRANALQRLEGTLEYMSPEQTGRINRVVDQRADLYSLGVTFYEMLTGRLPFQAQDPLEMAHCHLARMPEPPSALNPAVPAAISALVMKLLAKTPEERYRGALGLKRDLERCREAVEGRASLDIAGLGRDEGRDVLQIPQRLYGRAAEVESLLAAFERACAGTKELLLVSGYSGIGKSSLVHEVHRPIVARRGNFVSGKFDQYKRNIPYASIVQAFRGLIQQVLAEDERGVLAFRDRLSAALGANGQLLIDVIPELELVIGKQVEPPKLTGADAQRRFNETFLSFMRVFTEKEHPLVMFLDDLQWADAGTLSLIHLFMTDSRPACFLLIGAYRDNEVELHHPMRAMVDAVRAAGAVVGELVLKPFAPGDVDELVADALDCTSEASAPLSRVAFEKTRGNPFFVGQLLRSLHRERLVWFDGRAERWAWDLDAIQRTDLTENVVGLMVSRIRKLDAEAQAVMTVASCIGNTFDLKTLSAVHGRPLKETAAALWRALEETLIVPVSDSYKLARIYDLDALADHEIRGIVESTTYRFLHDRVQQAAYSLIPQARLKALHLTIARLWRESASEAELGDKLFEIASHYNAGIDLVKDREELYQLIELNLAAARKAKAASAFEAALQFCAAVMDRLPEGAWEENYRVAFACHLETGEAELLNGRYAEALSVLRRAELLVTDVLDRCKLCELIVLVHRMRNDLRSAFETGATMLSVLGVRLERSTERGVLLREHEATKAILAARGIDGLVAGPEMQDPLTIATCRLLQEIWPVAFYLGSLAMHVAAMKIVQISAEHGSTASSAFGFMVVAFAQVSFFNDIEEGYRLGLISLKLHDRFQNREVEAKILDLWGGLIQPYKEHLRAGRATLRRGFTRGMEAGDYQWAGYCAANYTYLSILGDETLDQAIAHIDAVVEATRKYDRNMTNLQLIQREAVASLVDGKPDPVCLKGEFCDEGEMLRIGHEHGELNTIFALCVFKLGLASWFGAYEGIGWVMAEAEAALPSAEGIWVNPVFHYFQSLALLAVHEEASPEAQAANLQKVRRNLEKLRNWMRHSPDNFMHMVLLLQAELGRVAGKGEGPMRLYDQAIASAREQGFMGYQALACERAAEFYRARGAETVASAYLKDARQCYLLWGASAKVRQLEERYPELWAEATPRGAAAQIDLLAVMKASQAISGELVLERLLEKLMRIAIESGGAEKGVLLLSRADGGLLIGAIEPRPSGDSAPPLPMGLEACASLPKQILRYAANARTPVLLDDATRASQFASDSYVARAKPKSILCLPILWLGQLTGLLYLENNLCAGAFTADRTKVLEMLAAQAAISLENARNYDELEQRVEERTRELREAQRQLIQAAREAGMADIATSVLHNVGNVLNSVSVSATELEKMVEIFPVDPLDKTVELLGAHAGRLPELMATERGRLIPVYLDKLAEKQRAERAAIVDEIRYLQSNVAHMRAIVERQQRRATGSNLVEELDLAELVDEALKIGLKAADGDAIAVRREFEALPRLATDRYKVQQILVNLVSNAVHALRSAPVQPKVLTVRVFARARGKACVEVIDNGVGIREENLARMFQLGFTTRSGGHGFGLHSSATAAQELGGALVAESAGEGLGATLRLDLAHLGAA